MSELFKNGIRKARKSRKYRCSFKQKQEVEESNPVFLLFTLKLSQSYRQAFFTNGGPSCYFFLLFPETRITLRAAAHSLLKTVGLWVEKLLY